MFQIQTVPFFLPPKTFDLLIMQDTLTKVSVKEVTGPLGS